MDADRFDILSRSLLVSGSRRRALALALSGALGVFGLVHPDDVDAHDALKACKKITRPEKHRLCVRLAKRHTHGHCRQCPQPPNPCQVATCSRSGACGVANRPRGFSCEDGLFCNGAETCDGHGTCLAGTPPSCDDGVCFTHDYCDEASRRCVHQQIEACVPPG